MTPQDLKDWLDIFGNAVWIFFAAGAVYAGIRYQFKELRKDLTAAKEQLEKDFDAAREQNEREHQEFKGDIHDHEIRMRRFEWNRPMREGD